MQSYFPGSEVLPSTVGLRLSGASGVLPSDELMGVGQVIWLTLWIQKAQLCLPYLILPYIKCGASDPWGEHLGRNIALPRSVDNLKSSQWTPRTIFPHLVFVLHVAKGSLSESPLIQFLGVDWRLRDYVAPVGPAAQNDRSPGPGLEPHPPRDFCSILC